MSGDQGSGFEWRRKRSRVNHTLERLTDLPYNLFSRRGAITDSAKRALYERGIKGQAQILKAPGPKSTSSVDENLGRFLVRVEVPERDPYELTVTQSYGGGYEFEGLREGALVECRVDPEDASRVLLIAPEPDARRVTTLDSSEILSKGKRATGAVTESTRLEVTAPGSGDPIYELVIEMRSEAETEPWRIRIGQRVPAGAEELVAPGSELSVAYIEVDDGDSAAVDWPATTGGRFS